jgi:CRISPR-associated helicase Cas3
MGYASNDFERCFEALTGNRPFPWQTRLFGAFLTGELPSAVDLSTGLGKTATIAVWLLALAHHAPDTSTDALPSASLKRRLGHQRAR